MSSQTKGIVDIPPGTGKSIWAEHHAKHGPMKIVWVDNERLIAPRTQADYLDELVGRVKTLQQEREPLEPKKCNCSMRQLMREGCRCGGV